MACSTNVSPTCTRVTRCLRRNSSPDTFQLAHSADPATSSPRLYTSTHTAFHPVDNASSSKNSHSTSSPASLRSKVRHRSPEGTPSGVEPLNGVDPSRIDHLNEVVLSGTPDTGRVSRQTRTPSVATREHASLGREPPG